MTCVHGVWWSSCVGQDQVEVESESEGRSADVHVWEFAWSQERARTDIFGVEVFSDMLREGWAKLRRAVNVEAKWPVRFDDRKCSW